MQFVCPLDGVVWKMEQLVARGVHLHTGSPSVLPHVLCLSLQLHVNALTGEAVSQASLL